MLNRCQANEQMFYYPNPKSNSIHRDSDAITLSSLIILGQLDQHNFISCRDKHS